MRRPGLMAAPLVALLLAGGCGGEPTQDDAETARVIVQTSAATSRAIMPLYSCVPETPECYTTAGPPAVRAITAARDRFRETAAKTDHECLAAAAEPYGRTLDAYLAAAEAAAAGDTDAVDAAFAESTEHELEYMERFEECGFGSDPSQRFGSEFRRLNAELLRIDQQFLTCEDEKCAVELAAQAEGVARELQTAASSVTGLPSDEMPPCMKSAVRRLGDGYGVFAEGMRALQDARIRRAERLLDEAATMILDAQESVAACFQ